ncbi:MAG: bifunctional 4-hydroxy-2-oxoglutarate aldolase/2-dehydro-3-deoxy-phosphogluconate aldolase [Candidatus Omnitrophota bacterium]
MIMNIESFKELPLMGILRGIEIADAGPLIETAVKAGLRAIEVTMNTHGAADIISGMCRMSKGRIMVGAGTVISESGLDAALAAGASFIVMPVCDRDIVGSCVKKRIPVFPGALTPQEVLDAWQLGATMVKVFPSGVFGPGYIKALKGPFDGVKLMAVGGVNLENIGEYFSSGADAVAFGASVFKDEWLKVKDFESIRKLIEKYVAAVREARGKS